ncbi:MAG TPA: acyltransferase [Bordetella sp.]
MWFSIHLDFLRGMAALVVCAGHIRQLVLPPLTGGTGAGGLTIGDEAVMVFFVLSGYLVGLPILRTAFARHVVDDKKYIVDRLARLWTVLLPALAIGCAIDIYGSTIFPRFYGPDILNPTSWTAFLGNLLFVQQLQGPIQPLGTNVVLWSLAYEFWFYVLAYLIAKAALRDKGWWLYAAATIAMYAAFPVHFDFTFLLWLSPILLPGLVTAFITWAGWVVKPRSKWLLSVGAALAFVVLFGLTKKLTVSRYWGELFVVCITNLLLLCLIVCWSSVAVQEKLNWVAKSYKAVAHSLSSVSYTLYLTHLPLVTLGTAYMKDAHVPAWAMFFILFIASIVWAGFLYFLFERHTYKLRNFFYAKAQKPDLKRWADRGM